MSLNSLTTALDCSGRSCKITTKADNIPWLTEIPDSWQVVRSLSLFSVGTERAREEDEHLSATQLYGVIPLAEYERLAGRQIVKTILHQEKRRHVERDDFVISMRSFQGGLERVWQSGSVRSSYVVLRPSSRVHVGFFAHLFKSEKFIQALCATSNFIRDGQDLSLANFKLVDLPLIPLAQQHQIAKFLDRKTAAIDGLITKKRKLVELLAEKRAALIKQAVVKGLDPTVPMKDSGIPWIGKIPAHWDTRKLSRGVKYTGSGTTPERATKYFDGGQVPWVTSSELRETLIESTKQSVTAAALQDYSALKVFPRGTVLVAMYGATIGRLGILGIPACCNQACCALVQPVRFEMKFLYWAFIAIRSELLQIASGGGQPNISQDKLRDLHLPCPSLEEQSKIVATLEQQLEPLEWLKGEIETQISRLQEYRQALITAAVTGQLEIPHGEIDG